MTKLKNLMPEQEDKVDFGYLSQWAQENEITLDYSFTGARGDDKLIIKDLVKIGKDKRKSQLFKDLHDFADLSYRLGVAREVLTNAPVYDKFSKIYPNAAELINTWAKG